MMRMVPIVPVSICGLIILNSIEQEGHFCGGCYLLFNTVWTLASSLTFRPLSNWYTEYIIFLQQL